jgi:oligopeptide/dipeptide ABC transporter ATP-binding protein
MIAMALACRPELLIADEPTTALDVTIQAQILHLMRELKGKLGTAMLLITHDMGVVRENADRVGVMYAGRLVEEASLEKIFSSPLHPYTRLLLEAIPSRGKRGEELATIKGIVPRATEFPEGCRFSTRCPWAIERCYKEQPPMHNADIHHKAACFRLSELHPDIYKKSKPVVPVFLTSKPPETLLEVRDLKMYFPVRKGIFQRIHGYVRAVDGISFQVTAGDTIAIVGESGCGKTTVGKTIVRLYNPTSGYLQFRNQDYTLLSHSRIKQIKRRIRMVFQDPFSSLNPRMTVKNIIIEALDSDGKGLSKKETEKLVGELLERVGLDAKMAERYPHQFSGGERQRICIARALAGNPELIICDEATSSLDVSVRAQILNLLQRIQARSGVAYIIITHDLSVVRYMANRVVVMYLGKVVEEGTVEEIFTEAKHPYTVTLLESVPRVDGTIERHVYVPAGDVPSPLNPPSGCHFHPRCPHALPECKIRYPDITSFTPTHKCRCFLYSTNNN